MMNGDASAPIAPSASSAFVDYPWAARFMRLLQNSDYASRCLCCNRNMVNIRYVLGKKERATARWQGWRRSAGGRTSAGFYIISDRPFIHASASGNVRASAGLTP